MFSPLAFPSGMIVYELSTALPPPSQLSLSPFEQYREPLAVICIADGTELETQLSQGQSGTAKNNRPISHHSYVRELDQELEAVRDQFHKAIVHQMFIFDYKSVPGTANLPEGLIGIPVKEDCNVTTMRTVMCDFSSMLLAEMTTLAKSIQGRAVIESPNQVRTAMQHNGYSWGHPDDAASRGSIYTPERTDSPGGKPDRSAVRMSMPAALRRTPSGMSRSDSTSRPTTPVDGTGGGGSRSPENGPLSSAKIDSFREHSRDRISVQGFGSGSTNEMSRNKSKGRIGVILGSMYLQGGRWNDALKELVEAAQLAKSSGDHLWHAKALELIMVSMFMLAWVGLDFIVPQICYTSADKAPYHSPSASADQKGNMASNRLVSLSNLGTLLPELLSKILHLYERSSNRVGESLPQLAFSESAIRFSKILAVVHLAGGKLNDDVLRLMIAGQPFSSRPNVKTPRLNIHPSRKSIVDMLFRAFPSMAATEELSITDRAVILGGIASVLGDIGYHRKKAMLMRELVSVMLPGLIQARIVGAAEVGIHPSAGAATLGTVNGAASVAALELGGGDTESGVDELLRSLGKIYGVVSPGGNNFEHIDDSDDAIISRIMRNTGLRLFGGQALKMNVLRACIDFVEALPDHRAILRFSSDLLRTAGSGIAPGPKSLNAFPAMSREEQLRLITSLYKYVNAGKKSGISDLAAEYWDEFLVRGVEMEPQPPSRLPIPHQPSELGASDASEAKDRNPFIYNPFLRRPDASNDKLLVAGENTNFRVTLQNPYDVDIEVQSIRLEADGVGFVSTAQHTLIGPYRTQILSVSGTPTEPGTLRITGCLIKVKGCRERRFPIFANPWSPRSEVKIKTIGLDAAEKDEASLRPVTPNAKTVTPEIAPPVSTTLTVAVTQKQPVVIIKSTTLSQSAVMILEGERQRFSITLENTSQTTPADLILFSFQDSTQAPLQTALGNRDASPAELYEYELILVRKQALHWVRGDSPSFVAPGSTTTFELEILGKPGLTNCSIQVDYCYLGKPASEVKDRFYTRQVSLPLTVTVNASIELARVDILPITNEVPQEVWPTHIGGTITPEEHCILLLDFRNAWPSPLQLQLHLDGSHSVEENVLPGQTSRILFPVQRKYIENPHASLPALDPSRQRQFVVSTGRVTADSERASRETFWYKEAILGMLKGSWSTGTGPKRKGDIELRGMRLSPNMIEAFKVEEIGLEILVGDTPSGGQSEILVDGFYQIRVRIRNRKKESLRAILRIQPSLKDHAYGMALDISRKLIWDGNLQRALSPIAPQSVTDVLFNVCSLCRGEFEISASIEELQTANEGKKGDINGGDVTGRPRANTKSMMDAILGGKERRIWHTREPCVLVARNDSVDGEGEETA